MLIITFIVNVGVAPRCGAPVHLLAPPPPPPSPFGAGLDRVLDPQKLMEKQPPPPRVFGSRGCPESGGRPDSYGTVRRGLRIDWPDRPLSLSVGSICWARNGETSSHISRSTFPTKVPAGYVGQIGRIDATSITSRRASSGSFRAARVDSWDVVRALFQIAPVTRD